MRPRKISGVRRCIGGDPHFEVDGLDPEAAGWDAEAMAGFALQSPIDGALVYGIFGIHSRCMPWNESLTRRQDGNVCSG